MRNKPFSAAGASLMFPRDPAGPTAETVNCGCQSLPLDGELGGQASRAQGVLGGGERDATRFAPSCEVQGGVDYLNNNRLGGKEQCSPRGG